MCRIAGIVSRNNEHLLSGINSMCKSMEHGGPDGKGVFIETDLGFSLGHRRLSIIDLSKEANQPMSYLSNRYYITFNGEIYNYKELKLELIELGYLFNTDSDTEVILAGYDCWKEALLPKLEGMFAFIIADLKKQLLFIARDHMGIKPLYFGKKGDEFYFSSEVRGFLAIDSDWKPNLDWRIWFLTYGFLPEPITTLQNVRPISKGAYMLFDLVTHHHSEYTWFNPDFCSIEDTVSVAIAKTKLYLEESVKKHLIADVEVGVFLSGGVDSSIIAILAQEAILTQEISGRKLKTLSIDFEDTDFSERDYQNEIVKKIKSDHYSFVVSEKDFVEECKNIFDSIDQPSTDSINSFFICKYAKQLGLKVVLSGLGADELFGGYPSFHRGNSINRMQRLSAFIYLVPNFLLKYPNKKIQFLKKKINSTEYLLYRGLFTPGDTADILGIKEEYVWKVLSVFQTPTNLIQSIQSKTRISILESDIYMLNQLLKDSDVQSMWNGIELRVPFLDKILVNYIFSLKDEIKYPLNSHKFLLIEAFRSILPEKIWNRPKQGFIFPFDKWMKSMDIFKKHKYVSLKFYSFFFKGKINHTRFWAIFINNTYKQIVNFGKSQEEASPSNVFIYLSGFTGIGGIETVNRSLMYCLNGRFGASANCIGLHDSLCDTRYFPSFLFKGFSGNKMKFMIHLIMNAWKWNRVIVGHINLAPSIRLMKMLNYSLEIWVVAHGIEVWSKQTGSKNWLLKNANRIISVSEYTKQQLINNSMITNPKIDVLHNCLDPFFTIPAHLNKPEYLQSRYGLIKNEKVIFTLSRLSSKEKYKGYDRVIECLSLFRECNDIPFKYLLAGVADQVEFQRLQQLIRYYQLEEHVLLVGYVSEDELKDYYLLADVFVMPSKKEGFGIVFIEAAACGTSVIAGNTDGSVEALLNGALGTLVDPDITTELLEAINVNLFENSMSKEQLQQMAVQHYDFNIYRDSFLKFLN